MVPGNNKSTKARRKLLNLGGGEFEMVGPITGVDFLMSDTYLAPFNTLTLTFTRHEDAFIFNTPKIETATDSNSATAGTQLTPKLKIKAIGIYARRIEMTYKTIKDYFEPRNIQRYLGSLGEVNSYSLGTGISSQNIMIYCSGVLPKQVVVGMVKTSATVGSYHENPFNFQPFGLNRISLKVNAIRVPQEPLKPDFDNDLYYRSYMWMLMNSGKFRTEVGNSITPETFKSGVCLFPFDLTPDACSSFHLHGGREGVLELELGWKTDLTEQITVFIMTIKDQLVFLDPTKMGAPEMNAF